MATAARKKMRTEKGSKATTTTATATTSTSTQQQQKEQDQPEGTTSHDAALASVGSTLASLPLHDVNDVKESIVSSKPPATKTTKSRQTTKSSVKKRTAGAAVDEDKDASAPSSSSHSENVSPRRGFSPAMSVDDLIQHSQKDTQESVVSEQGSTSTSSSKSSKKKSVSVSKPTTTPTQATAPSGKSASSSAVSPARDLFLSQCVFHDTHAARPSQVGQVYVFGSGDCGQLGLGEDVLQAMRPKLHPFFADKKIVSIAAGGLHNLALSEDGKVYSWGCNDECALGRKGDENEPALVDALENDDVIKIVCGDSISVALTENGKIFTWGTYRNTSGILGFSSQTEKQEVPLLIQIRAEYIVDVAAGSNHVLARAKSGNVYSWGCGDQGQLGRRILGRRGQHFVLKPEPVCLPRGEYKLSCGSNHSFAVNRLGKVWAWGLNNYHQCGVPRREDRRDCVEYPEVVQSLIDADEKVMEARGGEHHSLFFTHSGRLYGVGRCDMSQLGLGPNPGKNLGPHSSDHDKKEEAEEEEKEFVQDPAVVPFFGPPGSGKPAIDSFSCGSNHTLLITLEPDRKVYAWGFGEMHQLGNATNSDPDVVPQDEPEPALVLGVKNQSWIPLAVSAGGQHSVVLAIPKTVT